MSKEAWTRTVGKFNQIFDLSFTPAQLKQKDQDLKKDFKVVEDLISKSGFGWDPDRMMVVAPDNVWSALRARKNKDALQWQEKSFPYFDDLFTLYDGEILLIDLAGLPFFLLIVNLFFRIMCVGRYATGRSGHGMDYYANNETQPSQVPNIIFTNIESSIHFGTEEDTGINWFCGSDTFNQVATNSTQVNNPAFAPSQATTAPVSSQHVRNPRPSSSTQE